MHDRAMQALVKAALEPEWESQFEGNSYGFRPGRGCHDAIEAIFLQIRYKPKFVLDADIQKCFDQINQEALLEKLNTSPTLRKQIKAWLKAGVLMDGELFPTETGTPQGGVVSPLLANIALHGMEMLITSKVKGTSLIRYADDLVIFHENIEKVIKAKEILEEWLHGMGLELKPSKTRLLHTLLEYENQKAGFDFLGFNVRQYPVGKYQSGKSSNGKPLGFKTIIKPSKEKVLQHYRKLAEVIDRDCAAPQAGLIKHLNPMIRGWSNYYRTVCSKETYNKLNCLLFHKLQRWAYRRHPNKSKTWVSSKYWHHIGKNTWTFAFKVSKENRYIKMYTHPETAIVRHTKIRGTKSPYDGDATYWGSRMGKHPDLSPRIAQLLKQQKGKCKLCGLYFDEESVMEIDHITPLIRGGKDTYDNIQLLHRHCHHIKTANDGSKTGTHESLNGEEPCEVKVSRTVLKTSRRGDTSA
jgi:RNA-directed DNA polymerase